MRQTGISTMSKGLIAASICMGMVAPVKAFDLEEIKAAAIRAAESVKQTPHYKDAVKSTEKLSEIVTEYAGSAGSMLGMSEDVVPEVVNPKAAVAGMVMYDLGVYKALLKCSDKTASIVWRQDKVDSGNVARYDNFYINKKIPRECQPESTWTYKWSGKPTYDRGHLLDANGFDYDKQAMYAANYMFVITPQLSKTNRTGSWREIEKRMECFRTPRYIGNGKSMTTIAGVVWGDNASDDHFVKSHGQKTPSKLFKIVVQESPEGVKSYAWVVPNDRLESPNATVDDYLVSPEYIEQITGYQELRMLVPESTYKTVAPKTPNLMNGCDLS